VRKIFYSIEELIKLFDGLNKSLLYLSSSGLKGFLETAGVIHIEIDRFDFKLSREGEDTILSWYTGEKEIVKKVKNVSQT
jgi:hypothetical protein